MTKKPQKKAPRAKRSPNRKLTKDEILAYYRGLAMPESLPGGFPVPVPVEMRMKAFERLLQWMEIEPPATVVAEGAPQKMVIEIRTKE